MARRTATAWMLMALACGVARADDLVARVVSPGGDGREVTTSGRCPTFSWAATTREQAVELLVHRLDDGEPSRQVLRVALPGGARSWTPSRADCLQAGSDYAWAVRLRRDGAPGSWSDPGVFRVTRAAAEVELERLLGSLQALAETRAPTAAGATDGVDGGAPAVAGGPPVGGGPEGELSLGSATAALSAESPDVAGETIGVLGISNSPAGAGLVGSNTAAAAAADLLLYGQDHGQTNTTLTEAGVDRSSALAETFDFRNSGAGTLSVRVEGATVATIPVDGPELADGAVMTFHLADDAVVSSKIADGAVTTSKIGDAQVTAAKLFDEAVTTFAIAPGAVVSSKIAGGAVTTDKIGDAQVTAAKLFDEAVTTFAIAPGAVVSSKIADGAVTTSKIGDAQVTAAKLTDDSVTTFKLETGAVVSSKIADGAVTTSKIAGNAVGAGQLADTLTLDDTLKLSSADGSFNVQVESLAGGVGPHAVPFVVDVAGTGATFPAAIRVVVSGAGAGVTRGIDVSDGDLDSAIDIGGNEIDGTNFSVGAAGDVTAVSATLGSFVRLVPLANGSGPACSLEGIVYYDDEQGVPCYCDGVGFVEITDGTTACTP